MAMRMLLKAELLQKVPFKDKHIWELEKAGKFPRRRRLGPRRVAWIESEVDAWIEACPEGGPPAATKSPGRPRTQKTAPVAAEQKRAKGRERLAAKAKTKETVVTA
jgi:prophage regulatory protein